MFPVFSVGGPTPNGMGVDYSATVLGTAAETVKHFESYALSVATWFIPFWDESCNKSYNF
jgi:hypothetical protein